jgi:hypothetical protein
MSAQLRQIKTQAISPATPTSPTPGEMSLVGRGVALLMAAVLAAKG